MADHDQQKLIEVDANLPAKAVFKVSGTHTTTAHISSHILLASLQLITNMYLNFTGSYEQT